MGLIPLAERISFVGAAELVDKKCWDYYMQDSCTHRINVCLLYMINVGISFLLIIVDAYDSYDKCR